MRYLSRFILSAATALLIAGSSLSAATATTPAVADKAIRINAGASAALVDPSGKTWLADQNFVGGDTIERGNIPIANTDNPAIYQTERYDMSSFSQSLPNGKYTVKLHFAETFEEITGAGQRVFSFTVAGQVFKDFDVWVKAGGGRRAYVETVAVTVMNGKLDITFTANVQSPEINGIEIIPAG
jgi:endoglucanase